MEPFKKFTGTVAPLDRANVDTDAILPKQFLKSINKIGFGKFLFYDWRFIDENTENTKFILNQKSYREASILLSRKNFGCGSSREHAPWALGDYGFRVIIAPSFADIFYNNCFKNGILPIQLLESEVQNLFENEKSSENYELTINLENKTVYDNTDFKSRFEVDNYRREMLINAIDEIGTTIQHSSKIDLFEYKHPIFFQL